MRYVVIIPWKQLIYYTTDMFLLLSQVAYELKNLNDNITLSLAWFETFQSGTQQSIIKIPIYGPEKGDQKYLFQIWDAGEDGICCSFGQGTYQLYLGPIVDQVLLTTGSSFDLTETFEFDVEGTTSAPVSAPQPTSPMPILPIPSIETPKSPPSTPTSALLELSSPTGNNSTGNGATVAPSKMPSANLFGTGGSSNLNKEVKPPTKSPTSFRKPGSDTESINSNDLNTAVNSYQTTRQRLWMSFVIVAGCIFL
jgi:hypothetical protein